MQAKFLEPYQVLNIWPNCTYDLFGRAAGIFLYLMQRLAEAFYACPKELGKALAVVESCRGFNIKRARISMKETEL